MANSTVQLSVLLQILDGLGVAPTPLVNHQMPPVSYAGAASTAATQNTYCGYLTLVPSGTVTLFNNPPISPFLVVRNAGAQGVIQLTIISEPSFSNTGLYQLTPGGLFVFANTSLVSTATVNNYLLSCQLAAIGTTPAIAEYAFGI